ncbi:MAG TPA: PAS domain S-box protein, partial [Rhizomicrobium sp.]|nr:PAS domain S-box protein [Rhizomicrobium sp.]
RGVRESGKTFAAKDRPFYIERRGFGETVYFDVSYSAVREADGTIGGVLCIVSETTARVLAEQKARADRDRFAEMFRQAPSFMALLDGPEHIFTLTNDAYQQLIGHRDVTGKSIRDALPDLEGQGFYELLDEVYRSGKPYVGHDVAVSLQPEPGGKSVKRVLDFVYQPIKSTHGDVTGIFVEGHDITGTHLAERALGESEQRFNDIADATPVLIWISDTTKACTWFNKTWLDFTGRTMAQEMGNGWAEGVHPEDYDRCLATYVSAFDKHEPFRMLYRLRRHDGEWRVVDDNGVPRFTADGTFMGFIGSCIDVTDERAAQDAINHSEERLRLATENAGIGLFDIDPDGGIDFSYSRRSSTFLMDREKRVPMEHLFSRLHPEDVSRTRAIYEAARDPSRRERFDVEYRVVPEADQPMRWIKIRGRGVFDDAGKLLRISGTAIDISKEQEIQDALRRSEEQLRLASDNAEIGLWDMDVLHNTAYSTPRVKMIFGMPTDSDPAPDEFFALVHPDDIARVQSAYADAFDPVKRATYDIAYRVTGRDDGVLRWIHAKGRGVFDADGLLQRVTGTAADVTEQKEIAEALRRSEEQLRLATEYSEIGLWDIDIVNDIVYWPPRVNMMFGLAPDEPVTMKQFRASLHPEDKRKTIAHILEACDPAKRTFYDAEYRITRKSDGIVRWMAAKGRAVFDDQRRCVRMLGIIADVTERKEIEQRIHELNETLEKRVVERTAALEKSQAALQQAQKMEAIGNLTGGIAHDFNNLLQGLSGNLDLIRRRPDDTARVQRWAESGLQAAERGAKLTAQLLTFSRSQKLELRALDLAELLPSMRELLKRTLGPSVEVALDLEPGKQAVLGDETQLEMAVLNLAINARDAMPDGGKLSISTKSRTLSDDA